MALMIDFPFAGLAPWVAHFKDTEIPVLRHTVNQLQAMREDAENINTRKLATVIMHDPLMTLRVFCLMAEQRSKRQLTDITTVERVLMMLGVGPFFRYCENLPVVEQQLKTYPKAMLGLLQAIARSRHAAAWARDWSLLRQHPEFDEIALAALLHDFPEMLMWCFAPNIAINFKAQQKQNPTQRSVDLQRVEYGVALYEIKLALAECWHLPPLLIELIDPEKAESPNVRNVKLAVDLARHTANNWQNPAVRDDLDGIHSLINLGGSLLLERLGAPEEMVTAARALEDQNQAL